MTEASEGFQPVMVRDDAPALNTDKITFYEALQKTKASFGRRGKVTAEVSLKLSLTLINQPLSGADGFDPLSLDVFCVRIGKETIFKLLVINVSKRL